MLSVPCVRLPIRALYSLVFFCYYLHIIPLMLQVILFVFNKQKVSRSANLLTLYNLNLRSRVQGKSDWAVI